MGFERAGGWGPVRATRLVGAAATACLLAGLVVPNLQAQDLTQVAASRVPSDSPMLLEADTLIYDRDSDTVTAAGGVRIDYGGNRLVARRVTYDRKTGRLMASGGVEIVDPKGTQVFSDQIDITDDFKDGFVNGLRVIAPDQSSDQTGLFAGTPGEHKVYFGSESAERRGGLLTTFNNGVYTACKPCEEHPERAPTWRIKARKIIWNGQAKTVRFEQARFELFGFPLAQLPAFEIADPTVKRKTGFLLPFIQQKSELGLGVGIPYYIALSPTYDLLFRGTGYTQQGFLGEAQWRQRFNNGEYKFTIAGIHQNNPDRFDSNTVDREHTDRGMIGTTGRFAINERWAYGWDILLQSDKNFSRTYQIQDFDQNVHRSQIYLTGINDRNYFDVRAMHFEVQEEFLDPDRRARQDEQPWVLPSLDYAYTPDEPVLGGELNLAVNAQGLYRSHLGYNFENGDPADVTRVRGIDGDDGRLTTEAEWRRSFYTTGGLVLTPLLDVRADAVGAHYRDGSVDAIEDQAAYLSSAYNDLYGSVGADVRSSYYRAMATAGLEARWPILFSTSSASHIIEPMAQLFVRPNEPGAGRLGLINEDAQSLVFDASTLFERDKFSGYDRIEGGTRANLGVRYVGSFANGWSANAVFGQSFHLAGINSYAQPDLVNVGAYSGLETDRSDYVGMVGLASPEGLNVSTGARFDETTFSVRRAEIAASLTTVPFSVSAQYAFIEAQPLYGFSNDRRELTLSGWKRFDENWRAYGGGTYDFESEILVKRAIGLAYDDDCFTYAVTYQQTKDVDTLESSESVGVNISFRTLGDFGKPPSILK